MFFVRRSPFKELNMTTDTNTGLSEQPEALRRLFDLLASGQTPNFLEMMSAISDYVAFSTDCDPNSPAPRGELFSMSQKKCRICS